MDAIRPDSLGGVSVKITEILVRIGLRMHYDCAFPCCRAAKVAEFTRGNCWPGYCCTTCKNIYRPGGVGGKRRSRSKHGLTFSRVAGVAVTCFHSLAVGLSDHENPARDPSGAPDGNSTALLP